MCAIHICCTPCSSTVLGGDEDCWEYVSESDLTGTVSPYCQVLSVRTARYCQPVLSGTFRYCQPVLSGTVAVLSVRFVTYCEPLLSVGGNVSHYCMVLVLLSFFTITVLPACTASPYWQVLSLRVKLASRLKSSSGRDTFRLLESSLDL